MSRPNPLPELERQACRPAGDLLRKVGQAALSDYLTLLLTLLYFAVVSARYPDLASASNMANTFANMLPLLAVAVGQTIVLISGGIDLSVTSIIAMGSIVGAWIMNERDGWLAGSALAVPAAIGAMLAVGGAVGLLNGLAVTLLRMPPFIVTLTTMMFVGGLALWTTKSRTIGNLPESFIAVSSRTAGGIPYVTLLMVATLAFAAHFMLSRTLPGRWLYAVGMNRCAAAVCGVPVRTVTAGAYVLSGLCAAVGCIVYSARLECGSPTLGREILLNVIGAAVIGGTSLFGGRGKILWTVFGAMLLALIETSIVLMELVYFTAWIVKGGVILAAAGLDLVRNRLLAGR